MKHIELLYQNYLAEQQANDRSNRQRKIEYEVIHDFLELNLSPENYFEAENLLNDLILSVEQESFCAGIGYLPMLWKEMIEE